VAESRSAYQRRCARDGLDTIDKLDSTRSRDGGVADQLEVNFKMAHRTTPFVEDQGEHTASDSQTDRRSSRVVTDWYIRHASLMWCAVNVVAAAIVAAIAWDHTPHGILVGWLLFTSLNAVLYVAVSHNRDRWMQLGSDNSDASHVAMALAFGVSWGASLAIFGPYLSTHNVYLLIAVCLFISTLALPVFTLHHGAYPLFIIPVAALTLAGLSRNTSVDHIEIYVGLIFIVVLLLATVYATFIRMAVAALSGFSGISNVDAVTKTVDLPLLIEQRIRALKRLVREQRRATATLDAIGEAIITTNGSGLIDYMNPVAEVLTGVQFEEANGRRIEEVVNINLHSTENLIGELIEASHSGGRVHGSGEHTMLKRRDGVEYEVEYQITAIRNEQEEITGTSCLIRDVTTKQNLIKNVAWRSTHDPLTNLINRTEFEERIKNLLTYSSNDDNKRHALCFIDFDQFKFINDAHGIECGNHVLQSIALEIKQKIRGADTLARIGEDKFGVLLYSCPIDKARLIAEGLCRLIQDFQIDWGGIDLPLSVSVGVVGMDPTADNLTDILSGAEAACGCAKKDGGNRVHAFYASKQFRQYRTESASRLREIQSAVRSNRFELYFQPIHPIGGDDYQPRSCELLLRMPGDTGAVVSPRDLLADAEHYQLMPEIDRWTAKAAIDALRLNHPVLNDMDTVCINISGQSINDIRFLEFIVGLLDSTVDNTRICFNISEANLISNVDRARFFIATLKELGCRIALDDFGSGIGSFELLNQLQVDYLKINAGFVRKMAYNSVDYEIVLALIRIAKTLRIKTIASGVTTIATKNSLLAMGIDYIQGFLFDQPRPMSTGSEATHSPAS